MEGKGPSVLTDLADTAGGEPEHVLHQPVSIGVQRYQLLLDELLAALGGEAGGDRAQTPAVVRSEIMFYISNFCLFLIPTCRLLI